MILQRSGGAGDVAGSRRLAVSVSFCAMTGHLIHRFSLPPFLVTLAGTFFARGAAFFVSTQPIGIDHMVDSPTPKSGLSSA